MGKNTSFRYLWVFCVLTGVLFSGCAALVAGGAGAGGTYAYLQGWLERDYDVSLEKAHQASLTAVQNLEMDIVEETREIGSTKIKATKGDKTNWIHLNSKDEKLTTISVRSGLIGDETASRTIHREIEKQL